MTALLIWIAASFLAALFIGRFISVGMGDEQ